jgi:hypothetical protein
MNIGWLFKEQQVPPLRFAPVGMTLLFGIWILTLELKCHPDRSEA